MVEFDVRKTKDGVFIVYHDERIQGRLVRELTYESIRRICRDQGFNVPTVEEFLNYAKGKIKLDVELKEEGYEKDVVELILKYFKGDEFIITSFNDRSLKVIKEGYPNIKVGLLLVGRLGSVTSTGLLELFFERYTSSKADILLPHWKLLTSEFLKRIEKDSIPVFTWTINEEKLMWELLKDRRIHGIITDKPDLAVRLRNLLYRHQN